MIKAIETEYNGYKFRSRLEARWAVFFDSVGIKWEYESEGYILPDGTKYLPDFYLLDYDWFVEVKAPRESSGKELFKTIKFVYHTQHVVLVLGNIPKDSKNMVYHYWALYFNILRNEVYGERVCIAPYDDETEEIPPKAKIETYLAIDREEVIFQTQTLKSYGKLVESKQDKDLTKEIYGADSMPYSEIYEGSFELQELRDAYSKARKARFEHGETPEAD